MGAVQIMQMVLALLAIVNKSMAGGMFDPNATIELNELGEETKTAIADAHRALGH